MASEIRQRRVIVAGGNGFLGSLLRHALLGRGIAVVVLTRSPKPDNPADVGWDARSVGEWKRHLDGADAIVNLVGRSVDCVKNPRNRNEILRSRVDSTRAIGMALREIEQRPRVWLQMSTAHAFGDPPDTWCDERSPLGAGFAPIVAQAWEDEHRKWSSPEIRSVVLRTSFVISRRGGALPTLACLARFGLGGRIGTGRQGVSWIHEVDMTRIMERTIFDSSMSGMYVATAPTPVSMQDFMAELRRALHVPIGLPSPAWMVRVGSAILQKDPDLALLGRYCVSHRLGEEGFRFRYPGLRAAIDSLFSPRTENATLRRAVNRLS
ncbi:MAG: TIGR01777 family oxidoreductase [Phycisphaeraceae bacterium]|nr:TIGR01777 family oxidoreductase [Phycisphaeraceae bacterium]